MQRPQVPRVQKSYLVTPTVPSSPLHAPRTPVLARNSGAPYVRASSYTHFLGGDAPLSHADEMTLWDGWFSDLLASFDRHPFVAALEQSLCGFFHADAVVYWQNAPSLEQLYSETRSLATAYQSGLPGVPYFTRAAAKITSPATHPSYDSAVDSAITRGDSEVYLFPVLENGDLLAVVEIVRDVEVTDSEVRFATWFAAKCRFLNRWMNVPRDIDSLCMALQACESAARFRQRVFPLVRADFASAAFELWQWDARASTLVRHDARGTSAAAPRGLAWAAIARDAPVNCFPARAAAGFAPAVDGADAAVLAVPARVDRVVWCAVVRRAGAPYSPHDEARLRRLAPLLARAAANAARLSGGDDARSLRAELDSLRALIDVLELVSAQLDAAKLVHTIMDRGRGLTNAERCSLFLVNDAKDRLVTYLQTGLQGAIDIPADAGAAGRCVTRREVVNVADAYESPYFDARTDRESGYRTRALIAVPIFNNRGDVLGCTEFINKADGGSFDDWDLRLIRLFNVFCGISLENARLFQEANDMHQRMATLLDTAFALSKSEGIHKMLTDILHNAKRTIGADCASVFTLEPGATQLTTLIADGARLPGKLALGVGLAALAVKTKLAIVENDCYSNVNFNPGIDRDSGYRTESLLALPILDSAGAVLGVVELLNKASGPFTQSDVEIVNAFAAFAAFAAVALQNSRVRSVQRVVGVEAELAKWIAPAERSLLGVPPALELTHAERAAVLSMSCFAPDFRGIGHFKECFFFFRLFGFFELFEIAAEQFFVFLYEISARYTDTSYHNWTHACDVTQCIVFQLYTGRLGEAYEAWELFTLCVAAICHDTNHQGFNNVYNVKAETPLGILFKDQSVMEMHHITQAIPVINMEKVSLFRHFDATEVKKIWTLFIRIILSTDMARHFDLVKRAQAAVDEGTFNMDDEEFRLLGLQLIMKVADISNVARPFEIADRWCDILNEEFFHQGDLEKQSGIGLTSPLNDRETSNKPKSQIGFYNFICLPLYTVVAKLYPPLQVQVDQVKANLDRWKQLVAAATHG